jgi:hypothetical protein
VKKRFFWALVLPLVALSCSSDSGGGSDDFELTTSPQFVNRMIPGQRPAFLLEATGDAGDEIQLTGETSLEGISVVLPASVEAGTVAEVWVDIPATSEEEPFTITVDARRGDVERTVTVSATAIPGTDDVNETALDIAEVFLREVGGQHGLPTEVSGLTGGTPIAGLLVVTHYAWFTDAVEIDLAWHIMVAPQDWSELVVRPRDALRPTVAYRLSSWSTALNGGDYTVTEIPAPTEVTR